MLQHIYSGLWVEGTTVRGFGAEKWPDWDPAVATGLIYKALQPLQGQFSQKHWSARPRPRPVAFRCPVGVPDVGGHISTPYSHQRIPPHPLQPPPPKKIASTTLTLASTPKRGEKRWPECSCSHP